MLITPTLVYGVISVGLSSVFMLAEGELEALMASFDAVVPLPNCTFDGFVAAYADSECGQGLL